VRDEQLQARVVGSYGNTYRVEVWCEDGEVLSTCTCPYNWGVCKHIAATLCAWLNHRADPQAYTTITTDQWRAQLEAIPPSILIDQIMDEMRVDMLLERYVKRWLEKLSPAKLPNLITELFRHTRAGSPIDSERALERVVRILAWSESWPAEQAIKVISETLKQVQAQPQLMPQANADEVVRRSLSILRMRVPQSSLDASTRRTLLRLLVKFVECQAPAWQSLLTETLLEITDALGEREFLIDEVRSKAFGDDPGLMRLLARLYRLEGRMKEYEAARLKCLAGEGDFLELLQYYVEENRPEEAMILGEQGMKELGASAPQLAECLTALYLEWGERELARKHLLRCFEYWPSEKLVEQIESLSKGKRAWRTEQTRLQKRLKAKASAQ
jgi:tetratricopeptide (TPR) repeat protein